MARPRHPGPLRRWLMLHVVPTVAAAFLRLLYASWRVRESGREHLDGALAAGGPVVLAFLHGRTFALLVHMTRAGNGRWVSMCSQSLDGEAMARVEERFGLDVVRGSSGRGGLQAIQEMIRRVRAGSDLGACLAVDGSRGPRGRVQGGVVRLARWTGGVIVPLTASARPATVLTGTWDRTLLPLPFARLDVVYGEPIEVPQRLPAAEADALCDRLERRLVALQAAADSRSGFSDPEPLIAGDG